MNLKKHIPSTLTAMNLASGFVAIILNDPFYSPLIILIGGFFDLLDGAVARKLNASSDFGAELDSLADLITFGAAPAYLYYHHVLGNQNHIAAIIVTTLLVVFAGLRLAKFNIDTQQKSSFTGLPTPSTGLFFAFLVYEQYSKTIIDFNQTPFIWMALPVIFALLMVSPLPFLAMKKGNDRRKKIIQTLTGIIFILSVILWLITGMPFIPLAFILYIFISLLFCRSKK
ncbi:MAG TPA: CDP-diacylglycerol--serine O-phosphatidyltransferase [Saprospiraceae bacterium]|nr:CDP-diacylglycerol--serine O-phosphatidyltransferase [Saprospiraceae bacterium]HHH52055.1 CDP-diacylglycerol--serine O-phosphatidyltransferase [Bacteroidota bacterium]